jgi:hypothetical protein
VTVHDAEGSACTDRHAQQMCETGCAMPTRGKCKGAEGWRLIVMCVEHRVAGVDQSVP